MFKFSDFVVDEISRTNFNEWDLQLTKYKYVAHCTSFLCTGREDTGSVQKNVSKNTTDCPDCGSVLYWEKIKHGQ